MLNQHQAKGDLSNCDKEAIHLIGKIQAHGFLLIFDKNSLKLEQGSENVQYFLETDLKDLLGKPLSFFLSEEPAPVEDLIKTQDTPVSRLLRIRGRQFFSFIHESSGKIILEAEPYQPLPEAEIVASAHLLSSLLGRLNTLDSLESISELVVNAIQSILDIDRVLIFTFDQDWHAKVVAEKIKPGIGSYRGHNFPASDIPAPARALLEVKHIRHIPDITVQAVAISPYLNPGTGKPMDILQSELRYPSEIHLEYLENMHVFASLSFSIMVKGKLWGLVSCSNEQAKFFSFQKRQLCDQLVKAYANSLLTSKEKRDYQQFQHFKQVEKKLLEQVVKKQDIFAGLQGEKLNLLSLTEAAGAAVLLNNKLLTFGLCPEEEHILEIADWLSKNNTETIFHSRELSALIDSAFHYRDKACGLLALEISRFNKEYIFYFKPEVMVKRIWAGNPEKPVAGEGLRVHPRKSFEQWDEIIKGKSYPWNVNELEIAQILLKDMIALRLQNQNKSLSDLNDKYRKTANELQVKNEQLESFNHIITHNLRSPLLNIQGLYAIYKDNPAHADAALFLSKINGAADSMLTTLNELNKILKTRAGNQLAREKLSLSALIEKEIQQLNATIIRTGAEFTIRLLAPEVSTHKVYLESILHNLLSNALKYASPERKPLISIHSWQEKDTFYLSVSDNGLGIDLAKHGHKLFGIYQTFHGNRNARGVGLYLSKMQMESLGGSIQVQSEIGKGTTFTLSLDAS